MFFLINHFKNKLIDTYHALKDETTVYYKTDSHINIKGSYIVYKLFIDKIKEIYNIDVCKQEIHIKEKNCILTELKYGIGDLLWDNNLGQQTVVDKNDTFYYSDEVEYLYTTHRIHVNDNLKILNQQLLVVNNDLNDRIVDWNILSSYILYKKNICINKNKVLIFYDSFLTPLLSLYLELFEEVYMVKNIYNKNLVELINPDYVFEFRIERFLF